MVVNAQSGTTVHEIADGIYRISTPSRVIPGGFTFNQYLVADDEPLLFHTGPRKLFPVVREAVASVLPVDRLRWLGLSHFEADECGALNEFLAVAPRAQAVGSRTAILVSVNDVADRPGRALADGEVLELGRHAVQWFDAPHLPHAWETGYFYERSSKTLLCGDLFTQFGADHAPLTEHDILGPSEASRTAMDYYAHAPDTRAMLERLAAQEPTTLACMHGSAWRGNGAGLLRALADSVEGS
jgi:flavorubredoxin